MRKERQKWTGALVIVGLTLATTGIGADQEQYGQPRNDQDKNRATEQGKQYGQPGQLKVSQFIGKEVRNAQDENLGRVQDLILNMESGTITVPYAIVAYGGALGIGSSKIAVPMSSLGCSGDGKKVLISATKDEFHSASRTPSGAWSQVSGEWTRDVDGFVGQPPAFTQGRFERQPGQGQPQKELVRDPTETKGATDLLNKPATPDLNQKISACIEEVRTGLSENVQASLENGVVTLRGEVDTQADKQNIESKVMAIPGVQRVENHLKVKNQ